MQIFNIANIDDKLVLLEQNKSLEDFFKKNNEFDNKIIEETTSIIEDVKKNKDKALIKYSNLFDKSFFKNSDDLVVSQEEIDEAISCCSPLLKESLELAFARIIAYHKNQLPKDNIYQDDIGVSLGNLWKTLDSVGIYAPSGSAAYPSSVLMCAGPAIVSNVKEITLCTPTNKGKVNPAILLAANICGINKIYKIGGAQAISAMAYGTESVKRVAKIVGPGNIYVAMAKKILFGQVGIDMIAGPTDLTIICDENTKPEWIASDTISQLEHGKDSKVFIITKNINFAKTIIDSIDKITLTLSRKDIITESLKNSAIFLVKDFNYSSQIVDIIAPEHLEILIEDESLIKKINNAGAIFYGKYTPESIGDYIAGPSHVLPTESTARFSSGLSVYDFLKRVSYISCDKNSFALIANQTSIIAESEGLDGHKKSIDIRK